MRRKEKEITDRAQIDSILNEGLICHVACLFQGRPYSVPMCYGYDGTTLYLHSATEGKKNDCFCSDRRVSISIVPSSELKTGTSPCSFSFGYRSVIIDGVIEKCVDDKEKTCCLDQIVSRYTTAFGPYQRAVLEQTTLWRVSIENVSAKISH